jgi:dihydrodipicolinate synthase/N-acetylneuraminate lyase
MAANNEKEPVTFGVTIEGNTEVPKSTPSPAPLPPLSNASTMTTATAEAAKEMDIDSSNPYSAFYKHPDARRSFDSAGAPQSKTHLEISTYERDLEAGVPLSAATTQQLPKVSVDGRVKEVKECTMWPSRQAVLDKRRDHKRKKGCNLFQGLTTKQRLWIKIIIALLVVGAAVGLGVGISRAVGGGVWAGEGKSKEIPHS